MNHPSISFIGGGNMARGILGGLIEKNYPSDNFTVVDPNEAIRTSLTKDFGIVTHSELHASCLSADYLILATKPQVLKTVCHEIGTMWTGLAKPPKTKIISIAAGIRSTSIENWLNQCSNTRLTIIRAMPNTPALIGLGATGLFCDQILDEITRHSVNDIFSAVGTSIWVDEEDQMDTVTALSGSGPAYFFLMLESLVTAAIKEGLSPEQAQALALQTALGATSLALQTIQGSNDSALSDLRERVTSKGGTTAAGLTSLRQNHFPEIIAQAIQAAKSRSQELSDEYGR